MLESSKMPNAPSALSPLKISQVKPAIATQRSDLWVKIFYAYTQMIMRKRFFAARVKNAAAFQRCNPKAPTLCLSNHCNWWDGLTDFMLVSRLAPRARLFAMIEELHRFPLLAYVGGFSVEKSSAATALRSLQYAVQLLESNPRNLLWLYPQGAVRPQEHRPLDFTHGVGYLAQKIPTLNILPVAQYYSFHREDLPEIFMEVGDPVPVSAELARDRKAFSRLLEANVTGMLDNIAQDLADARLDAYETLLQGSQNPFKALEQDLYRARDFLESLSNPSQALKLLFFNGSEARR